MKGSGIGLDFLKHYFAKDAFAEFCGIEITEAGEGRATAMVRIEGKHLNGIGIVHGGLIFTLADMAFAAAVHTRGSVSVSINSTISYIKAAKEGYLRAEASEVSRNNRIASYLVNVKDESGEVLASFQGLAYVKNEKLQ